MPPVQTAFAKHRSRKNNELDSLCHPSKNKMNTATMHSNINESQKRIRAILDRKHNQERPFAGSANLSDFDAHTSSFNANGTHRDLKSLDHPDGKGQKYDREQRE